MNVRGVVLVIAASDSSGGAGLTRDAQTLGELGVAMCCAVTAVTVQTDLALRATHPVPPHIVRAQIRAALDGGAVAAIKIGMLGTADIVRAVAESLPSREQVPIVLDPVLAASAGGALLDRPGVQALYTLLPRVGLLTPNVPEAAALLGDIPTNAERDDQAALDQAALEAQLQRLLALGPAAVLIKGGHRGSANDQSITDTLAVAGRSPVQITVPRVRAQRRGTGCSLSSAIAAHLAAGSSLIDACSAAQSYVAQALRRSAELQAVPMAQPISTERR